MTSPVAEPKAEPDGKVANALDRAREGGNARTKMPSWKFNSAAVIIEALAMQFRSCSFSTPLPANIPPFSIRIALQYFNQQLFHSKWLDNSLCAIQG